MAKIKNKKIRFEVEEKPEGLMLITNGENEVAHPELIEYLKEYVNVARENLDTWVPEFKADISAQEADIFRVKLENNVSHLKNSLRIALLENKTLKIENRRFEDENNYLRELAMTFAKKETPVFIPQHSPPRTDTHQLLHDLLRKATRMAERKRTHRLEDSHNDLFVDWLRDRGYHVADQSRSGKAKTGAGELDAMIREKDGTPVSIIEAFRLKSCGPKNDTVSAHVDKLLHDYDTSGHARNFILVYAEAKEFESLWGKYLEYIRNLHEKPNYRNDYPLQSFVDESKLYTGKTDIRVGLAKHTRHGKEVEVYHVFVNMAGSS